MDLAASVVKFLRNTVCGKRRGWARCVRSSMCSRWQALGGGGRIRGSR